MKKQIVFVEYVPNIINLKIAKALKLKGGYETILVTFSSVDRELYDKVFDRILVLEMKHKINVKNIFNVFKKISSREGRKFIKEVKNLNPYLFQITGPDLFTMVIMLITKKKPKIYFAYDIWAFCNKKFSLKNIGFKELIQQIFEKIGVKRADGIIHKGPPEELKFSNYKVNKPDFPLTPGCLDEWTYAPEMKKNKELHLVFAGGPLDSREGRVHFLDIIKIITQQRIHFHTYGKCVDEEDNEIFAKEEKENRYYHFHEKKKIDELNKEISKYDYGINPDFYDISIINPLWPKTSVANRIFNYIEAGIPIIINTDAEYMAQIVTKNKIGFVISYKDLKKIKDIIKKQNYTKLLDNVKKAQKKLSWNKVLILELEKFYEKIGNRVYCA